MAASRNPRQKRMALAICLWQEAKSATSSLLQRRPRQNTPAIRTGIESTARLWHKEEEKGQNAKNGKAFLTRRWQEKVSVKKRRKNYGGRFSQIFAPSICQKTAYNLTGVRHTQGSNTMCIRDNFLLRQVSIAIRQAFKKLDSCNNRRTSW